MPIYATLCSSCAESSTVFRHVADRNDLPSCGCGGNLCRVLSPPMLSVDIEPYVSPASGELITSRKQRTEEMTRLGFRTYEPGMKKDIARNRAEAQEKALAPILKGVDEIVTSLNTAGKLENLDV